MSIDFAIHNFVSIEAEEGHGTGSDWVDLTISHRKYADSKHIETFALTIFGPRGAMAALAHAINSEFGPTQDESEHSKISPMVDPEGKPFFDQSTLEPSRGR